MESIETLESRIYVTENELYAEARELTGHLHEIERAVADLHEAVHRLVCESPRIPSEVKAFEVIARLGAICSTIDLETPKAYAEKVAALKAQIDEFERQIQDRPKVPVAAGVAS